jgi:hypothetical protein
LMPALAVLARLELPPAGAASRIRDGALIAAALAGWGILEPWMRVSAFNTLCIAKNQLFDRDYLPVASPGPTLAGLRAHRRHVEGKPDRAQLIAQREQFGDEILHKEPSVFVAYLDDLNALTKVLSARPSQSYRVLDFADPTFLAANALPARIGTPTLHYNRNISASSHPSADEMFAKVDAVLVPKCSLFRDNARIVAIYADALNAGFAPEEITDCWTLHTRRSRP